MEAVDRSSTACCPAISGRRAPAICRGLIEGRLGLLLLRVDDFKSTLCCIERGPCLTIRGPRFLVVGIGLLEPLK